MTLVHTRRLLHCTAVMALLISYSHVASAQADSLTNLGPDELYSRARVLAFNGQRTGARTLLFRALAQTPDYADVRILLARTYGWDGSMDTARTELTYVLSAEPSNRDAWSALLDVELWDGRHELVIAKANSALVHFPNDPEFLIRKARAYRNLELEEEALATLNRLEDVHPSAPGIAEVRSSIRSKFQDNTIAVAYANDRYSSYYDPMHYASIQYSRRTPLGTVIGRINHSSRFGRNGAQVEADMYPRITDGTYAYVNYGVSGSSLFPDHRFGIELFRSLPKSFEASAGLRYSNFGAGSSVAMYTGSVGFYSGSYWFSVRPFLIPGSSGRSHSLSLTVRRYLGEGDNFVSGRIGAGFSPDERNIQADSGSTRTQLFSLKAQSIGFGWQQMLTPTIGCSLTADYMRQEVSFLPDEYVSLWSLSAVFRYKF